MEKLREKAKKLNIVKVKRFSLAVGFTMLAFVGLCYLLFQFVLPMFITFVIATLDRWFSGQVNFLDGVLITLVFGWMILNKNKLFGDDDNEKQKK